MLRLALPALLLLIGAACAAQQRLAEDLTAQRPVPQGSDFDGIGVSDPDQTGVAISPRAQHVIGPARLRIANRTGRTITCEVYEDDLCPSLGSALDELAALPTRNTWKVETDCTLLDVVCLPEDADDTTLPIRVWSWFVEPPPE